jgi:hypothetical protein
MRCYICGGAVVWRGPLTALTHTECLKCGGENTHAIDEDAIDHPPEGETSPAPEIAAARPRPCLDCSELLTDFKTQGATLGRSVAYCVKAATHRVIEDVCVCGLAA